MIKYITNVFIWVWVFFIVLIFWFYLFQEKVLFRPNTKILSHEKYTSEYIQKDEIKIPILYSLDDSCDTVILFFHWNWWNIYTQDMMYWIFDETQQCFLAIEYPWYGLYDGKITSINDLYKIWEIWYFYLIDKWYTSQTIIPRWYSMGWWIASYISHKYFTDQLVLQSTYTSLWSIAQLHFPFLPVKYLFKYNMKTDALLREYTWKVTIFHGKSDTTVPYNEAIRNYSIIDKEVSKLILFDWWHNIFPRQPFINTLNTTWVLKMNEIWDSKFP